MKKLFLLLSPIYISLFFVASAGAIGYHLDSLESSTFLYNVLTPETFESFDTKDVFATSFYNGNSLPLTFMSRNESRFDEGLGGAIGDVLDVCMWDDFRCIGSSRVWAYNYNFNLPEFELENYQYGRIYLVYISQGPFNSKIGNAGVPTIRVSGTTVDDSYSNTFTNDVWFDWSNGDVSYASIFGHLNYACSSIEASLTRVGYEDDFERVSCSNYYVDDDSYAPFAYLADTEYEYLVVYYDLSSSGFSRLLEFSNSHDGATPVGFHVSVAFDSYSNSYQNSLITTNNASLFTGNSIMLDGSFLVFTDEFDQVGFQDINGSTDYLRYYEGDFFALDGNGSGGFDLSNLFDFTAINPFSVIFTMFVGSSTNCVQIPTLAGMLNSPESTYCSWWPQSVRGVLTPVFSISASMILFGFFVSWLRSDAGDGSIDNGGTQIKVRSKK